MNKNKIECNNIEEYLKYEIAVCERQRKIYSKQIIDYGGKDNPYYNIACNEHSYWSGRLHSMLKIKTSLKGNKIIWERKY